MTDLIQTFTTTKRKIALMFSLSASVLIALCTIAIMFFINFKMKLQAKELLANSLQSVEADFQADQLKEVSVSYQSNKSLAAPREKSLANIFDIARKSYSEVESADMVGKDVVVANEAAFEKLKNSNQVYSRVILANGDILYSSDLFDTLLVDHTKIGFGQYTTKGICIYVQTARVVSSKHQGATIQVGVYCPFTPKQQQNLALTMTGVALLAALSTYGVGLVLAAVFIRPIHESATHTRIYAQNVYHELFTPVSVAITSVAAAMTDKDYKAGLKSVDQDLRVIQQSLQLLNKQAFQTQADLSKQAVNLAKLLMKLVQESKNNCQRSDLVFNTQQLTKEVYQTANTTSFNLMVKNLLSNAIKYAKVESAIEIILNKQHLMIKNEVSDPNKIQTKQFFSRYYRGENSCEQQGKGLGLALVKELATIQGWKVKATLEDNFIKVGVIF